MEEICTDLKAPRIVIISGSPGAGKTTAARILAENSPFEKACHIEVDDFWQYIRKGYIHPWLDDSGEQNEAVIEAVAASAEKFCEGGYDVYVAGTIGPWFIGPWFKLSKKGIDVRYVILRPDEKETVSRVAQRQQREAFPLKEEIVRDVWRSFANLGKFEANFLDTTSQTAEESTADIRKRLGKGDFSI